jgi:Zn-dependent metalloprotease
MAKKSILQNSDVRWDELKGRIKKVRGEFFLPVGDTQETAVKAFLQENAGELGLVMDNEGLRLTQNVTTPVGTIYRFQQQQNGIPIFGTEIVVQLDKDERVKQLNLEHVSVAQVVVEAADAEKLTAKAAQKAAVDAVGEHTLRRKIDKPEEIYYPTPAGLRLAYKVLILTKEPFHDWRIIVDAHSGEILAKEDLLVEMPDGQGLVFDPNPVVTAHDNTLRDPNAAASCSFTPSPLATINAQRVTRVLRDLTLSGGTHKLDGPFIRVVNTDSPNINPPEETNADDFNYSSDDNRIEAVNVYYHVDTVQRYIQSLGITTAHNSQVEADVHAGSGGASYSPSDDTLRFGNSGDCNPNRASDGDVALHEYGHGIQHDQVPNWGLANPTTGRNETRAMGEGFGDILACVFFAEHGGGFQREVFEDWIFSTNGTGGLRRVDGAKIYPDDWVGEEHADGEIWSAALWNVYRAIGGDSADPVVRLAARDALLKTVILSHHKLPGNASMPDGAEAVMETNAELDEFRGVHLREMLDSVHDRGLLRVSPNADLFIRDAAGDPGADNFTGVNYWNSPDLWNRQADDGITTHQVPEFGQDNWFYARVQNRGTETARAFVVTFNVKPWAGTEFTYPGDFVPFISAAVGFNLVPGTSTIVKAKWPAAFVPPPGNHPCWLASVYTPTDVSPAGRHVWEHNNLAQKNLTVIDVVPGDALVVPVQLGNRFRVTDEVHRLEVRRPRNWSHLPVAITHSDSEAVKRLFHSTEEIKVSSAIPVVQRTPVLRFLEPSQVEIVHPELVGQPIRLNLGRASTLDLGPKMAEPGLKLNNFDNEALGADLVTGGAEPAAIVFQPGVLSGFPVGLKARRQVKVGLKITVPQEARPGQALKVDLVQRNSQGNVVGGITVHINVARKS